MKFIQRNSEIATLEKEVRAPYFRRAFFLHSNVSEAKLCITGLGFYDVYVNGHHITKGFLAPYRSNLDHYVYFDEYEVKEWLSEGNNVIACVAGNGWKNAMGGFTWKFDQVHWLGSPQIAFCMEITCQDGTVMCVESDEKTRTADSPILFNDLHYGEYYDARLEIPGWELAEFDDSEWDFAEMVEPPLGELRLCRAEPIVASGELKPISIRKHEEGYIYDFGENNAGLCRLQIQGTCGQKILLQHFETLVDDKPFFDSFRFRPEHRFQEDEYTCSGQGLEIYMPRFTYHGFRYVYVTGIREEQATQGLLTYVLIHSNIEQIGEFVCDDEIVNQIQEATVRSDISNFHYFPTDCPQREKNGWTADASLSAEQMLLNFDPVNSYKEWLRNMYKALTSEGELPGVIPTAGWSYTPKGGPARNGPAWDSVLINLPYYSYRYRGDVEILKEAAIPMMRYLTYLYSKLDDRDLLAIGLGDWCQPRRSREGDYATPLVVTDSIVAADIATKAAEMYQVLHMPEQTQYAKGLYERLKKAVRTHLMNPQEGTVYGDTQTGQAIALAYGMFEESEKEKAVDRLLELIEEKDRFMDTGVIGARVIFRVLAEYGYADLAYHMITRPEYPSYGNWMLRGATTLWEGFWRDDTCRFLSMNHHFWGDVSAWFYIYLAGIHIGPPENNMREVLIAPCFVKKLNCVKASYLLPEGKLTVQWKRMEEKIVLEVTAPKTVRIHIDVSETAVEYRVCKME